MLTSSARTASSLVERSDDFERLNDLLNHPAVHPWICGDLTEPLDASPLRDQSILLEAEHGMFWFIDKGEGVWEPHAQFLPTSPNTFECALEAIDYIRSLDGYKKIVAQGPRHNLRLRMFIEKLGFTYTHTEGTYQGHPLDYYEYI